MFISKKLFLLFQNVTKIVFSKFHEFLKNEKLCVFIVMVHKICQKFYKSALFPKNNALLFSKVPYAPVLEEVSPAACILFQASRTYPVPDGDMEEGESSSHLAM